MSGKLSPRQHEKVAFIDVIPQNAHARLSWAF